MNLLPNRKLAPKVLALVLPVVAGLSTQMILSLVDTGMVGRLSDSEYTLAAMGIGNLATWAIVAVFSALATGTHILVARNYGAMKYNECKNVLVNSLFIGITVGIVAAILGILLSPFIANFFAKDAIVAAYASSYMQYRFLGLPFFLITVSYRGFYFGMGNTKVFMVSAAVTNLVNILLNYCLIFGEFGFPQMGIGGAALATSIATVVDAGIHFSAGYVIRKYRETFQLFKDLRLDAELIKTIVQISLPVSFQSVFILLGFLSFVAITGLVGTVQQAATQAIIATLFMSFLPSNGFGIASQTLVGNAAGKKDYLLARALANETAKLGMYYTVSLGIVFILWPKTILSITTDNASIINVAEPIMFIAGLAQIFFAPGFVFANGLQSLGFTKFVMTVESSVNLLIFVPLSYLFGIIFGWGLMGNWLALPSYTVVYAFIMWVKFRYGNWENSTFKEETIL